MLYVLYLFNSSREPRVEVLHSPSSKDTEQTPRKVDIFKVHGEQIWMSILIVGKTFLNMEVKPSRCQQWESQTVWEKQTTCKRLIHGDTDFRHFQFHSIHGWKRLGDVLVSPPTPRQVLSSFHYKMHQTQWELEKNLSGHFGGNFF